ncbi:MarR family transcriptional regulator [Nocardioides sp. zg-536]|uniref:MarR family transcriptional regulator n=1 Tax=Nocardioides faecalis TaxID=2803858 RepID=A0A938Y814_9ACTN|nr:MarR family transcriptional regulator [Nocardioides faecalis]MBM9460897.1 MarR family transcriptional regulator [Nocardioides faecalis]MBS4751872.1 MarR family transcriptional regulator [Nocardioides faecalis]QVI59276.1 MarR family transcriptional regulator [Nocardioides faecalis]
MTATENPVAEQPVPEGLGDSEVQRRRIAALQDLETEVAVTLRRLRRVIAERAREVHAELQPASYLMFDYIRKAGPVRASAVRCVFGIDKGAISRQVQHLLDLGLVEGEPDPADGRATLLSASAEGIARLDRVADSRRVMLAERLADWSAEDLEGFSATLHRYNTALGTPEDG